MSVLKDTASHKLDSFFDQEIKAIAVESRSTARRAAQELYDDVQRQIRRNFNNKSAAFSRGITIHEFEDAIYVRLSPILSVHAEESRLQGNPNLWILLPDGARLGFKRMGSYGITWDALKRRYGSRLRFAPLGDGHVLLFRSAGGVVPIYKIQSQVRTKQRIEFYEKAQEIANERGLETENNPDRDKNRGVGFKK